MAENISKMESAAREAGKEINTGSFNILLSHRPEAFKEYIKHDFDLVFTGHAHGGQFRLPFIGGLYAPSQGLAPRYDAGMFEEDGTIMIVSRGLGQSIIPFRLWNPPELVIVELTKDR